MPTTRPDASSRAPPEFPGEIDASVWIPLHREAGLHELLVGRNKLFGPVPVGYSEPSVRSQMLAADRTIRSLRTIVPSWDGSARSQASAKSVALAVCAVASRFARRASTFAVA
jgi:hypothetical protein